MNNREQKLAEVIEKKPQTQPVQHHPHAHAWDVNSGRPVPLHIQQQAGMSDYDNF